MTQETADRLLGSLFVAIVIVGTLLLTLWFQSSSNVDAGVVLEAVLLIALLMIGTGTVVWALFHQQLATVLFRPGRIGPNRPSESRTSVTAGRTTRWFYEAPRWLLPGLGAILLLTLFALAAIGTVSVSIAFTLMAIIAFGGLGIGLLLPESEEEDRRADLPLTLFLLWAALYLLRTGLFFEIVAALSWPGFIFGALYVYWHDHPRWWIVAGFPLLVIYNLTIFFAFYRA